MQISKPTIETFLQEALDPIYVQIINKSHGNSCTLEFHASAFNEMDKPVSYSYSFPSYFIFDDAAKNKLWDRAKELEIKFKNQTASRKILPGIIAEQAVSGEWPT